MVGAVSDEVGFCSHSAMVLPYQSRSVQSDMARVEKMNTEQDAEKSSSGMTVRLRLRLSATHRSRLVMV